jgi:hypothetical protein
VAEEKLPPPPKADAADVRHRVEAAIAATNSITGVVAAIAGLLTPPLEQRRTEWFEQLWEALTQLQNRLGDFDINELAANEQFVTAVLHATTVAVRTHRKEKHDALRNAVLNVAAGTAPEDDLQMMFLDALDDLTPSHIGVLASRANADKVSAGESMHLVADRIRPAGMGNEMLAQIVRDLESRGFVETTTSWEQLDASSATHAGVRLTEHGKRFLDFVASPLEE